MRVLTLTSTSTPTVTSAGTPTPTVTSTGTPTSTPTGTPPSARWGAPTSLLRLEWIRWVRTHRLLGLGGLFLLLGLCLPIVTANLAWLMSRSADTRDLVATLPTPTPADGIGSYLSQVAQLGVVVLIASVAGPLCPYGHRSSGLYYWALTRGSERGPLPGSTAVLLPRFAVAAASTVVVFLLGLVGAWYETAVLIGAPDPGRVLGGAVLSCLYLIWVVAVVAVVGARADSSVVTVGLSVLIVIIVGIAGHVPWIGTALPSRLMSAPQKLLRGSDVTAYLPAAGVSLVLTAILVATASLLLNRREL